MAINNIDVNPAGFAISAWFKTMDLVQDARIVSKAINNFIQGHIYSLQISSRKIKIRLKLSNDVALGTVQFESVNDVVSANAWYNVVLWYNGCELKVYLNGVEIQMEETGTPGMGNNETAVFADVKGNKVYQNEDVTSAIGSQPVNPPQTFPGWRAFNGCIDQVIFFYFQFPNKW